jgi:hypothetical protein
MIKECTRMIEHDESGTPILDAYEDPTPLKNQRRCGQLSTVYAWCPNCRKWRIHGRALNETTGLIYRYSHCVDCPTELGAGMYALRVIGVVADALLNRELPGFPAGARQRIISRERRQRRRPAIR